MTTLRHLETGRTKPVHPDTVSVWLRRGWEVAPADEPDEAPPTIDTAELRSEDPDIFAPED